MVAALSAALASPPAQDSVTGTASSGEAREFVGFTFDAHSGPSGENPTGTVTFDTFFTTPHALDVVCLGVSGSRATIIVRAPAGSGGPAGLSISVRDGGPGATDGLEWHPLSALPPDCPAPDPGLPVVEHGDLVVVDAPALPTSKEQCKKGGWRLFGFKNQGACVSFVATGPSRPAR
jgi:hypothetical protein